MRFNDAIVSFKFKANTVYQCMYLKVSGSKVIFLILYIGDILLATNDLGLLHETKKFLSRNFEVKDMGEVSYMKSWMHSSQRDVYLGAYLNG